VGSRRTCTHPLALHSTVADGASRRARIVRASGSWVTSAPKRKIGTNLGSVVLDDSRPIVKHCRGMNLRRVARQDYHNYLLIESVETPKGPRQRVKSDRSAQGRPGRRRSSLVPKRTDRGSWQMVDAARLLPRPERSWRALPIRVWLDTSSGGALSEPIGAAQPSASHHCARPSPRRGRALHRRQPRRQPTTSTQRWPG
jgi:hypothetical protein